VPAWKASGRNLVRMTKDYNRPEKTLTSKGPAWNPINRILRKKRKSSLPTSSEKEGGLDELSLAGCDRGADQYKTSSRRTKKGLGKWGRRLPKLRAGAGRGEEIIGEPAQKV